MMVKILLYQKRATANDRASQGRVKASERRVSTTVMVYSVLDLRLVATSSGASL